jgi:putative ABC transport system ATP-binding protein
MIELQDIQKTYQTGEVETKVLKGINLTIKQGEFIAIMGPSGSGKSTLLNIIGCLDNATSGVYQLGQEVMTSATDAELTRIRREYIGFVFQLFNLIPRIDAIRNVELPMIYARIAPEERRQRAIGALKRVGLDHVMEHTPAQLSGGQQQRVAIARALVTDPALVIADEPTGSLDTDSGQSVMGLFQQFNADGKTVVLVTHEEEIAAYAQRIVRVRDGLIESIVDQ